MKKQPVIKSCREISRTRLFKVEELELKEEIGYGAREWHDLSDFTLSPNYMTRQIHVLLARDLYEEKLEGDEPEPLEVETFAFDQLLDLFARPDFTEARVIAALFLAREKLQNGWLR